MKKIYTLAATVLALSFLINRASAQTYTGGTYTAVRSGNWHTPSGPNSWDPSGEPPSTCNSCLITINSGVTIKMNMDLTLSGNSLLQIGSDASTAAGLIFPFSNSTPPPTPFPNPSTYHRINLIYGSLASIKMLNTNTLIDATATGPYDGVFLAVPTVGGYNPYFYIQRLGTSALYPNSTTANGPASISSIGTLPIVLTDFNALRYSNVVSLSWITQIESNSDHFAVQRSTDGGTKWKTIGTVPASGSSFVTVSYSYTDENPATGVSQYRLQSFDKDGKYTFSPVRVVRTGLITGVSVFPNPARNYVNISLGGDASAKLSYTLRLVSQSGQVLVEKTLNNAAGTTVSLPVNSYPQGNYLIMVSGADGSKQTSMLFISRQ